MLIIVCHFCVTLVLSIPSLKAIQLIGLQVEQCYSSIACINSCDHRKIINKLDILAILKNNLVSASFCSHYLAGYTRS